MIKPFEMKDIDAFEPLPNFGLIWRHEIQEGLAAKDVMVTQVVGGQPVAIIGAVRTSKPHVFKVWSLLSRDFKPFHAREMKRFVDAVIRDFCNFEIHVEDEYKRGEDLAKFLGFKKDGPYWTRSA